MRSPSRVACDEFERLADTKIYWVLSAVSDELGVDCHGKLTKIGSHLAETKLHRLGASAVMCGFLLVLEPSRAMTVAAWMTREVQRMPGSGQLQAVVEAFISGFYVDVVVDVAFGLR